MLFKVPLTYTVDGVPKGKRNPTKDYFWEIVEIDIPVLNDEVAPVAVVWDDSFPYGESSNFREKDNWDSVVGVPEDGKQMTRLLEGEHYFRRADRMTPKNLAEKLLDTNEYPRYIFNQGPIPYKIKDKEHPVSEVAYREDKEFSSTFDEELKKLRDKASEFFIVDDDFFVKNTEPLLIRVAITVEDRVLLHPRILPKSKIGKSDIPYSLDRFDEVVEKCQERHTLLKGKSLLKNEYSFEGRGPQIFIEGVHETDIIDKNLVAAAELIIENLSKYSSNLGQVNPDYGIAILNLRKGISIYHKNGDLAELEKWATILVEDHEKEVRHSNLGYAIKDIDSKPISIETSSMNMRGA